MEESQPQQQSQSAAGGTPLASLGGGAVPSFKDLMGFDAEVIMYEDDMSDPSIPDIQKITKRNNILPHQGNVKTMNLNSLLLENVLQSGYFKNYLEEVTTFQQLIQEIYYNVAHLEPWERGTRRMIGMSGMCGGVGVRGVGAGGVVSTAFCLLYKLFTLRATRKQLVSMINSRQSVYIRGIGLLYIRYTQPPADLWAWFEPYLDDEEEVDPRSGGGEVMQIGHLVRTMLTKLDFYGTLFPRIPVPIQKDIEEKLRQRRRDVAEPRRSRSKERRTKSRSRSPSSRHARRRSRSREGEHRRHDHRSEQHSSPSPHHTSRHGGNDRRVAGRKFRCAHHLRHHHCRKHRDRCPSAAKLRRREHDAAREKEVNTTSEGEAQQMAEEESISKPHPAESHSEQL